MKVTHDEVIRNGERELIDGITADLDWDAVESLFRERHHLSLGEDVSYKNGDLVVHENRVAYLLEFEVKVCLSMLVDREGDCVGIQSEASTPETRAWPLSDLNEEPESLPEDQHVTDGLLMAAQEEA